MADPITKTSGSTAGAGATPEAKPASEDKGIPSFLDPNSKAHVYVAPSITVGVDHFNLPESREGGITAFRQKVGLQFGVEGNNWRVLVEPGPEYTSAKDKRFTTSTPIEWADGEDLDNDGCPDASEHPFTGECFADTTTMDVTKSSISKSGFHMPVTVGGTVPFNPHWGLDISGGYAFGTGAFNKEGDNGLYPAQNANDYYPQGMEQLDKYTTHDAVGSIAVRAETRYLDFTLGATGAVGPQTTSSTLPGDKYGADFKQTGLHWQAGGQFTINPHARKEFEDEEICPDFDKEDPAHKAATTDAEAWKSDLSGDAVKTGLKDMGLDDAVIGTLSTGVDYLPKYGAPDGRTPVANDFAWSAVITAKVGGKDVILWDESQLAKGGNLTPLTLAQIKTWIELNSKYVDTVKKVPELQNVYRQDVYKFKTGRPTDAELGVAASKSSLADLEAYISSTILSNGAESAVEVKKLVEFINNNDLEDYKFYLHGTASVTGGDQSNWDLSNRRAKLVQIWLEKHGLHPQGSLGTGETPSFLKVGSGEAQVDKAVYVYFAPMPSPIPTSYKDTSGLAALKTYTDGVAAKPVLVVREGLAPDVVQASPVVFEDNVTFIEAVEKKTANPDENVSCDVLNVGLTPMKADGTPEGYAIPNASKNDCTVDYYPDIPDSDGSTGPDGTSGTKKAAAKTGGSATAPKNKAEIEAEQVKIESGTDTNGDGKVNIDDSNPPLADLIDRANSQITTTKAAVTDEQSKKDAIELMGKTSAALAAKRDALKAVRDMAAATPPAKFGGKKEKNDYLMKRDVQIAQIEAKIGK